MGQLPPKQRKILEFIQKFSISKGYPPTYEEVATKFHIVVGTTQEHISALIKKGYLKKVSHTARGIRVVNQDENTEMTNLKSSIDAIPLYGNVAAGEPLFADNNIQGYVLIQNRKRSQQDIFALKIKGTSMKDAGILEDDIVIVKKQNDAENGDIVIALIDDEATVKTLRKKRTIVYLEPANPKFKPITDRPFKVLGKVVELRRKYQVL
jgi:repressor LexA